jgi:DNA polymerase-3 subunit epsilon
MTGGQATLLLDTGLGEGAGAASSDGIRRLPAGRPPLNIIRASANELEAHWRVLQKMGEVCLWPESL